MFSRASEFPIVQTIRKRLPFPQKVVIRIIPPEYRGATCVGRCAYRIASRIVQCGDELLPVCWFSRCERRATKQAVLQADSRRRQHLRR